MLVPAHLFEAVRLAGSSNGNLPDVQHGAFLTISWFTILNGKKQPCANSGLRITSVADQRAWRVAKAGRQADQPVAAATGVRPVPAPALACCSGRSRSIVKNKPAFRHNDVFPGQAYVAAAVSI
jgi:hypothetical protein